MESIIVRNAIFGCPTARNRTTVNNAGSVALAAEIISPIATIAACVSMHFSSMNTTASLGNTCPTVRSAKRTYSRAVWLVTKCHVGTQFTGIVSASYRPTIYGVLCVRRRRKLPTKWKICGTPWPWRLRCSRCLLNLRGWWIFFATIVMRSASINDGISWAYNVRDAPVLIQPLKRPSFLDKRHMTF